MLRFAPEPIYFFVPSAWNVGSHEFHFCDADDHRCSLNAIPLTSCLHRCSEFIYLLCSLESIIQPSFSDPQHVYFKRLHFSPHPFTGILDQHHHASSCFQSYSPFVNFLRYSQIKLSDIQR